MKINRSHLLIQFLVIIMLAGVFGCRNDDGNFQVVVINTQEELERLLSGGSNRYEGDLILSGNVTSLEVFGSIEKIIGNLAIIDTQVTTLDGLENIILITGDITITSTPPFQQGIIDFCALQNLLQGGSFKSISITNNLFNPSVQEILDGDCRF